MSLVVAVLVGIAVTQVPEPEQATQAQTTTLIYNGKGGAITKWSFGAGNRTIIDPARIPKSVKYATVSAEDRTYFDNHGISPLGILRAAWNDVRGKPLQGGSTITQQYVKNTMVTNERSVSRKVKEFFIAIKISNTYDKDVLLGNYLNTIYFGRRAYGIQAAAQAYFHKNAFSDDKRPELTLTVPEAAYLAGIIDGPSLYDIADTDPPTTKDKILSRTKARYDYVLDGMVTQGAITQADRDGKYAAMPTPVPRTKSVSSNTPDDQTDYLTQMVKSELQDLATDPAHPRPDLAPDKVETAGYNIYTTFDKTLMDDAVKAVKRQLGERTIKGKPNWLPGTQIGLVSLDPRNGAVRAIYGGDGVRARNAATQDEIPAGSTFKLFSLLAGLEGPGPQHDGTDGIALTSTFNGRSPYKYAKAQSDPNGSTVSNFGGENFHRDKWLTLKEALAESVNTVFAQLNEKVTPEHTKDVAERAGIPKENADGKPIVGKEISNTLGNAAVTVEDMASAYGTVAANGTYAKPYVIDHIVTADGSNVVYRHNVLPEKKFNKDVCADAIEALQGPITDPRGTARSVDGKLDRPVAGKTGTVGVTTSRDTRAAWFVGFTPQLVTAVGMHRLAKDGIGQDDVVGWGRYNKQPMQGGKFPAEVWTDFMKAALNGAEVLPFPDPVGVGTPIGPQPVEDPQPSPSPSVGASPDPNGQQPQPDPNASPTPNPGNPLPSGSPPAGGDPNNPGAGGQGDPNGGNTGNGGNAGNGNGGQGPSPQGGPNG